ncbi:MAG: hypothetical protein ABFD84_00480 [Candidatus Polarisedimenticolia bacterium]|nr:hypothetical protein [bacterium]
MADIVLTGCDGGNPLGFLAALGAFRVVSGVEKSAAMHWSKNGRWRAVLTLDRGADALVDAIFGDAEKWRKRPELELAYKKKDKADKVVRDLKAPPEEFRNFAGRSPKPPFSRDEFEAFVAAYGSDVIVDGQGNTKPTAFHFTAGQQQFLGMVIDLVNGLQREHLQEALFGPWKYESKLPILRWDVSGERLYALSAVDPARDKALGVPGADWLAFQALPLFPSFPVGQRLGTTGFVGRGKDIAFRWPMWIEKASLHAIKSLLMANTGEWRAAERKLRGIDLVFESKVRRSDRGYGVFAAPEVV